MATLAPLRTLIFAAVAILLAWLSGRPRIREAAWLVYPILLAGGLHLIMEDLRSGARSPWWFRSSFTAAL